MQSADLDSYDRPLSPARSLRFTTVCLIDHGAVDFVHQWPPHPKPGNAVVSAVVHRPARAPRGFAVTHFRPHLVVRPLRSASASPPSGCSGLVHPYQKRPPADFRRGLWCLPNQMHRVTSCAERVSTSSSCPRSSARSPLRAYRTHHWHQTHCHQWRALRT